MKEEAIRRGKGAEMRGGDIEEASFIRDIDRWIDR